VKGWLLGTLQERFGEATLQPWLIAIEAKIQIQKALS
jgi:hypothetical protein